MAVDLRGMKIFPVTGLQRAGSSAVGRKKRGSEVAVFDAGEIFAALPDAGTPVIEAFEFFVREKDDFSVFGVKGVDGFNGRGIGDGQVAESAEPGKAGLDGLAIELGGDVDVYDVTVIEMKVLGDFEVAVAPGKLNVGGRAYEIAAAGVAGSKFKKAIVGGLFEVSVIENQRKGPAADLLGGFRMDNIQDPLRLVVVHIFGELPTFDYRAAIGNFDAI